MINFQNVDQVPWFAIPLATAALACVGGWLGGKLGVARETEKLIKQRAFDHRLEWYVRTVRTLSDFQFLYAALNRPNVDRERANSHRAVLADLAPKLSADVKESLLFGSPRTANSLETMHQRLNQLMARANAGADDSEAAKVEIHNEFARVYGDLARDVREHLGLEELPEGHFLAKPWASEKR